MESNGAQITCLYDMDIPRPDNFNETYLYEGMINIYMTVHVVLTIHRTYGV